jgi:hypothetical protein
MVVLSPYLTTVFDSPFPIFQDLSCKLLILHDYSIPTGIFQCAGLDHGQVDLGSYVYRYSIFLPTLEFWHDTNLPYF